MKLTGKIAIRKFAPHSKSEYDAVFLDSDQGSYLLRKAGANPFDNEELKNMEGKQVTAEGIIDQYQFLAHDVREMGEEEQGTAD